MVFKNSFVSCDATDGDGKMKLLTKSFVANAMLQKLPEHDGIIVLETISVKNWQRSHFRPSYSTIVGVFGSWRKAWNYALQVEWDAYSTKDFDGVVQALREGQSLTNIYSEFSIGPECVAKAIMGLAQRNLEER